MFTLPHFCRICLKYDKNLIDLAHIENEPSETLMSKLQFCASEVEWNTYKPLLCHPCIKRLNIAYCFKKECIQSANVLKSYMELLKESHLKSQSQNANSGEAGQQSGTYMLLPNQKYLKILVGTQAQNQNSTFQNVFLNVIPSSNPPLLVPSDSPKNKDTNQNIFLNINNIFKKYVPIAPNENTKGSTDKNSINVNQLLTDTKTEELSVEIDPKDFGLVDEGESSTEEPENDWDEVISHTKINSDVSISKVNGGKVRNSNQKKEDSNASFGTYVPILPRGAGENTSDEKIEMFNAGQHFLSSSQTLTNRDYFCESCQRSFAHLIDLKLHFKQYHMGKLPFKCDYCYIEFALRSDYELCMKYHKDQGEKNSLTLKDFANGANNTNIQETMQPIVPIQSDENGDFVCEVCRRAFSSSTGLLRHKVRKHNQKNKKKYFIKGMKNAQCDICKREFSTQSYMQLHRKLHLRDVTGYKCKVLGKNKYVEEKDEKEDENKQSNSEKDESKKEDTEENPDASNEEIETVDCTPDMFFDKSDDSEGEEEPGSIDEPEISKEEKESEKEEKESEIEEKESEIEDKSDPAEEIKADSKMDVDEEIEMEVPDKEDEISKEVEQDPLDINEEEI